MIHSLLMTQKLTKDFKSGTRLISLFNALSVSFESGHSYALMGPSGSGKSTLIHMLSGLESPTSGSILYEGQDLALFTPAQRSAFRMYIIGLIFQHPSLIKELSVLENTLLPALVAGSLDTPVRERAVHLLDRVGLRECKDEKTTVLSGGQQQRVAFARALLHKPRIIFADEPTGSLDSQSADTMMVLLKEMIDEERITLIMCTHDERLAQSMNHVLAIENRDIHEITAPKE